MVEIWNWARTFSCRPRLYVEPKSLESLHSLIQQIDANRWKVRLIGCGHSPSSLALSDEVLISMKHFDQIIEMNVEEKFLHCQAGVLISTLNEILPSHQLSLPVQGSISALTIGGAISTGTHGSGLDFGTLSSYLRFVRLMKLNGEIVECHRDDPTQSDLFRSLSCSLGAFGIILDVQIDLSPLFYLELHQHRLSFSSFVDHLPVHVAASDHFRYMWFPHTDGGIAYHLKRVPPSTPITQFNLFQRVFSSLRHRIIGYHFLEILFYVSLWFPRFVRWINRLYLRWEGGSRRQVSRCDHLFNFDCLFRQYANEWSVPLDEAVACLVDLEAAMETNHHVHFPIEIRFGRAEWTSFLSPSFGRSTCWINTVAYRPFGREHSEHRAFFREFERICLSHGGRPHWAKEHPLTSRQLAELYPQWTVFHQHRRRFDPNDLLINSCLKKMFLDE